MHKLLLSLNRFFKSRPHPFNMGDGVTKLNYHNFEYESAPGVFKMFEKVLGEKFWKEKSICDFACGAGGKSLWILEQGAKEVTGIDMSETLISQAKNYDKQQTPVGQSSNGDRINDKLTFLVGDVSKTECKENSFDLVIANDIMEHVGDPLQTLQEANRITKKGGHMCINFEPYFHFLGHHMWDVMNIPWAHVFFSEKTRIRAYKELVKNLPDGPDRIEFRISKNKKGEEYIGYLNHITIQKFLQHLKKTPWKIQYFEIQPFEKPILKILGKLPITREFFCQRVIVVLEK